jgi:hypothetical protein
MTRLDAFLQAETTEIVRIDDGLSDMNDVLLAGGGWPCFSPSQLRCGLFLERVAARLTLRGRFDGADLDEAVHVALYGVMQGSAA